MKPITRLRFMPIRSGLMPTRKTSRPRTTSVIQRRAQVICRGVRLEGISGLRKALPQDPQPVAGQDGVHVRRLVAGSLQGLANKPQVGNAVKSGRDLVQAEPAIE